MTIIVLANKADMKNLSEVGKKDLAEIQAQYNVKLFSVSAWSGQGLNDSLRQMIANIVELIDLNVVSS